MTMPRGTKLAFYLALTSILIIVFASLYPFSGWRDPGIAALSFLSKPLLKHVLPADLLINFSAYVPLGFFVSMAALSRFRHAGAFFISALFCCLLSLSMESIQMYLPARVASGLDWLANSCGGMSGALVALRTWRLPIFDIHLAKFRDAWILNGNAGDAGIALIALWLFTQVNPSLPLMGSWVLDEGPLLQRLFSPHHFSPVEAGSITLNLLSFGLVASLMLRPERSKVMPVVLALFLAILIKSAMAGFLLKPDVFFAWANQEAIVGVAIGLFLIFTLRNFPPRIRATIAAAAILAQIAFTGLTPDIASPTSELFLFDWKYGQLITLNGATSFLAKLWPYLALLYLGFIYRRRV